MTKFLFALVVLLSSKRGLDSSEVSLCLRPCWPGSSARSRGVRVSRGFFIAHSTAVLANWQRDGVFRSTVHVCIHYFFTDLLCTPCCIHEQSRKIFASFCILSSVPPRQKTLHFIAPGRCNSPGHVWSWAEVRAAARHWPKSSWHMLLGNEMCSSSSGIQQCSPTSCSSSPLLLIVP